MAQTIIAGVTTINILDIILDIDLTFIETSKNWDWNLKPADLAALTPSVGTIAPA
jgi:hypothetical protein